MKDYGIVAIPLIVFVSLYGIPKLISYLFNLHSDLGLLGILLVVTGLFVAVVTFINSQIKKVDDNEDS